MNELAGKPPDTTDDAWRAQLAALRRMGIEGRARMTFDLMASLDSLLKSGVRLRHPDYDDRQVQLAVMRIRFGEELFREVFPDCDVQP